MNGNINFVQSLVGLTENEALDKAAVAGYSVRIIYQNDDMFLNSCDFRVNRINLCINEGKIFNAKLG